MLKRQTYVEWLEEAGFEVPENLNPFLQDRLSGISREETLARLEAEESSGKAQHFITQREGYPLTKYYVGRVLSGEIIPEKVAQQSRTNLSAASEVDRQKIIAEYLQVLWYAPYYEEIDLAEHPAWQENLAACAKLTKTNPPSKMVILQSDFVEAGMASDALKGALFVTSALLALPPHQRDAALRHEMGRELYHSDDRGRKVFVADKLSAPKEIGVGPSIEFLSQKAVELRDRNHDFGAFRALINAATPAQETSHALSTVLRAEEKIKSPPLPNTMDRIAALLELQKQRLASNHHAENQSNWAEYILHRKPKSNGKNKA